MRRKPHLIRLGLDQSENKEEIKAITQDLHEETFEGIAHESAPNEVEGTSRLGRDNPFEFGKRNLTEDSDVWNHNAWDNVEWGEEQIQQAEEKIKLQYDCPVSEFDKELYNSNPSRYWDIFYKNNKENFFKDRKWLQIEFPIYTNLQRKTQAQLPSSKLVAVQVTLSSLS